MDPAFGAASLVLFFTLLFAPAHSLDCNADDRSALLRVKYQLGNPAELSTWLPATNCCDWWPNGLYCDVNSGRIYLVALVGLNLSAPVPPALGDLTELATLQIQYNPGISGPIPSSFAKLSKLEILDLSNNSISGPVPDFLTSNSLLALSLENNMLSGPIPAALAKLSSLRFINLSGNRLTGPIPPGLLHGVFRFLYLSGNMLTGTIPEDYGEGDLDTIDVSHNSLSGDPSSVLFGIAKPMTKIDLSFNRFAFDMTKVMFPHHLTYLDLSHNRITGRVAKSLMDVKLSFFNVSYNELCGEIPTGRYMASHGAECYLHNKCLCGAPLTPCKKTASP